jgi:acyl-CoA thioester hydrolase
VIGLVIETQCNYFAPLAFPQTVEAGLRVAHMGTSSVRYEVGLFAQGEPLTRRLRPFRPCVCGPATGAPCPARQTCRSCCVSRCHNDVNVNVPGGMSQHPW